MYNTTAWRGILNGSSESQATTVINVEFEIRNIVMGCFGLVANIIAFYVVLKSDQVTKGRKLLLLNLTLTDCIFMTCLCMYGFEYTGTRMSEGAGCVPMIFFIMLSFNSSATICLMLSVVNFLAIYKPFEFTTLVSWKNTGIGLTINWVVMGGTTIWWIGFQFSPGFTCAPLVVLPTYGLVGMAFISLTTSMGVFTLNTAAFIKLKKMSVLPNCAQWCGRNPRRNQVGTLNTERGTEFTCEAETPSTGTYNTAHTTGPLAKKAKVMPSANSIWTGDNDYEFNNTSGVFVVNNDFVLSSVQGASTSQESTANILHEKQKQGARNSRTTAFVNTFARRDKICKMLVVLTSYSCLLTLPLNVYLICIATGVISDPEEMVATPLGIFISSCPVTKAGVNPFFYALKFVDWRNMRKIFKRRP